MIVSVAALIFHDGKYLLQRRDNDNKIFFPYFYGFFGGKVDLGETPLKAIKRELKEELNLNFTNIKSFFKVSFESNEFKIKRLRFYYNCILPKNYKKDLILLEGESYHFFNIKDIPITNTVPWDISMLNYHHNIIVEKNQILPNK